MSSTISFYPSSRDVELMVPPPKPASQYVERWFKDLRKYGDDGIPRLKAEGGVNGTVKACMPFFDVMTAGWIQESWCDIWFEFENGECRMYDDSAVTPVKIRSFDVLPYEGIYPIEFVWQQPWYQRTPEGWSTLVAAPFNRMRHPFVMPSGIVDSDTFYHAPSGNIPFYLKEGFQGIIPKGTPLFQIIPIKREDWKHKLEPWDEDSTRQRNFDARSLLLNRYRRMFHSKKRYE